MKVIHNGIKKKQECYECKSTVEIDLEKDLVYPRKYPMWVCPVCGYQQKPDVESKWGWISL